MSKIYILVCEGGEYSDKYTYNEAASYEKQKLEDLKAQLIAENKLKRQVGEEYGDLQSVALKNNPFVCKYPVRPKGPKQMKNKEDLAEFNKRMDAFSEECKALEEKRQEHMDNLLNPIKAQVMAKFNVSQDFIEKYYCIWGDDPEYHIEEYEPL